MDEPKRGTANMGIPMYGKTSKNKARQKNIRRRY